MTNWAGLIDECIAIETAALPHLHALMEEAREQCHRQQQSAPDSPAAAKDSSDSLEIAGHKPLDQFLAGNSPPAAGDNKYLPQLNEREVNLLTAIGPNRLTGEKVAQKAGYPFNSTTKQTLASMRRNAILRNRPGGYEADDLGKKLLAHLCPDKCPD
jgi:hypothetical protein